MELRPYQQAAANAAIDWVKQSVAPCLIEAATAAGKSLIIAEMARVMFEISKGKHVLCLAPSKELVTQNRKKFLATGNPASLFSASAGQKCLRHPVVFATPGTFKAVAKRMGGKFCAVIIDECHKIASMIKTIIEDMKEANPNLRVIGLTATPSRQATGYVYRMDENGRAHGDDVCRDPYFVKKVYTISAHELLRLGYVTRPVIGETGTESYDTSSIHSKNQTVIDRAFEGHGRKTAAIVADVIERARGREGVMFFAATLQHADEIMASLPPGLSHVVKGDTPSPERDSILSRFAEKKFRYLVNVGTLTTGYDAPHVGVIAILRALESVELLQQIIGRGMRLYPGKEDFLILDYGNNIDRHFPDGDIFKPQIKAKKAPGVAQPHEVECPACSAQLEFNLRPMEGDYEIDKHGYYTLEGRHVETEHGPTPAHYGRRCYALVKAALGRYERCNYRWTFKPCPHCDAENDIAARYCKTCKGEIIDPAEKLTMDFKALKQDPTRTQTDEVLLMHASEGLSRKGNRTIRVDFETPYRKFSVWYTPDTHPGSARDYQKFCDASNNGEVKPSSVTYRKGDSNFYSTIAFGLEVDALCPLSHPIPQQPHRVEDAVEHDDGRAAS